mgnify:CR=1 FL=1
MGLLLALEGAAAGANETCADPASADALPLTIDRVNPHVIAAQYAVRGRLLVRAGELEAELKLEWRQRMQAQRTEHAQLIAQLEAEKALREVDGLRRRAAREDALPREGLELRQVVGAARGAHRLQVAVGGRAEELHDLDEVLLRRVLALEGEVAEEQLR